MPALDILNVKDNEGTSDTLPHDFNLLFVASGDPRNVIKPIVGLPDGYTGELKAVLNDKDFLIVACNAIMLLITLHLDPETAVSMIIHLWYSALLPSATIIALENKILPLIQNVCDKIEDKPDDSLQAETFSVNDRKLRIVLKKADWWELAKLCKPLQGFTAQMAQAVRRAIMLAPERVDYRDRDLLNLPKAVRQGETHFRNTGILLPYGCSTTAFTVPNPTLFPARSWSIQDSSTPREGWLHSEYMEGTPGAKDDEFGALFFHLRRTLLRFCQRVQDCKVSIQVFKMDAQNLEDYVQGLKFDRIEIFNICDRGFICPQACIDAFSSLLKPKMQSAQATLLMLFINAAREVDDDDDPGGNSGDMQYAMNRIKTYLPMNAAMIASVNFSDMYHPHMIMCMQNLGMFKDWNKLFDQFVEIMNIRESAKAKGLKVKENHTIVRPWPTHIRSTSTKQEFDVLRASGRTGHERYMEFESAR